MAKQVKKKKKRLVIKKKSKVDVILDKLHILESSISKIEETILLIQLKLRPQSPYTQSPYYQPWLEKLGGAGSPKTPDPCPAIPPTWIGTSGIFDCDALGIITNDASNNLEARNDQ